MIIKIAGVKVQYASFAELEGAIKAELAKIETRLKKIAEENKRLRRASRGLKQALEGRPCDKEKGRRTAPAPGLPYGQEKSRPKQPATSASAT